MKKAFDTKKYVDIQKAEILRRLRNNNNKLYFELGGKLFDDYHAARVLPGFEPDAKIKMLESLKNETELVLCINSENIQNGRIRSDFDILYTDECIRLIKNYRNMGFLVSGIALTVFKNQKKAIEFAKKLKGMGENVYYLNYIENYPKDMAEIFDSFEKSDFIITTRPLVVMTSPGSGSGKLSACLCQIYNEYKHGNKVGYAKYDIFPVWNLAINHPINVAFQAATADLGDEIIVDKFYYAKYHKEVSNYNRDMDVFPVIREVMKTITGEEVFSSPTEMVINTMKYAIIDEEFICKKAKEEVCRRYLTYKKQFVQNNSTIHAVERVEYLMNKNGISIDDLKVVPKARALFKANPGAKMIVLELENGKVITGTENDKLSAGAALLVKVLEDANGESIDKEMINRKLYIHDIVELFIKEKKEYSFIIEQLKGLNAHSSFMLPNEEEREIKALGINFSCES